MGRASLLIGIFYLVLIFVVYRAWFTGSIITGGDLWYYFPSMFDNHKIYPSAWAFFANNGLGGPALPYMAVGFFLSIPFYIGKTIGIPWKYFSRIFILFPFLILVSLAPFVFFKKLFGSIYYSILSSIIFSLNTYILMLVSGGLVIIGIAYSLIPLSFFLLISLLRTKNRRDILFYIFFLGLLMGIQSILDVRVTYMTFVGMLFFALFKNFAK